MISVDLQHKSKECHMMPTDAVESSPISCFMSSVMSLDACMKGEAFMGGLHLSSLNNLKQNKLISSIAEKLFPEGLIDVEIFGQ